MSRTAAIHSPKVLKGKKKINADHARGQINEISYDLQSPQSRIRQAPRVRPSRRNKPFDLRTKRSAEHGTF